MAAAADGGGEPDYLAGERATAQFDVDGMKVAWAGSRHAVEVADRMARLVASDPVFHKDTRTMLSWKELFKDMLKKAAHAWKRIVELRLTEEEANLLRLYVNQPGYVYLHWACTACRPRLCLLQWCGAGGMPGDMSTGKEKAADVVAAVS